MTERRLAVWAHPDDEYLTGYSLIEDDVEAYSITATLGEASQVNYTSDPYFCCGRLTVI